MGRRPSVAVPTSHWFYDWQRDYGRVLILLCFGYDPETENFDQSPFHNNEVGAQNNPILAVAGLSEVPLLEGRHDVPERWTGNFTTWSNPDRILSEGPPYCELMFKGSRDGPMVLRLREHCRSRGYGPWLTITCQEKGSYRECDILDFLERSASDGKRKEMENHHVR